MTVAERFLATAESERHAGSAAYQGEYHEENYFTDIKRVTVADHLNHTLDNIVAGADEAIRINNDQDETTQPIGTALMREVFAGDTLDAEVYVKYEYFPEGSGSSLTVLSTYLAGAFGLPATGEGAFLSAGNEPLSALMATGLAGQPEDVPRAGLGYLLFDRDLQLVDQGWAAVTTDARIPQDEGALTNHPFERLALENVPVKEAGFIYWFVANYDLKNISTFFDDFAVEHSTTGVLYAADHMPFGLKMSGRTIERTDYRKGFQGEWSEEEEETGELAFQLRMYSPVLGRWLSPDPMRQHASPYLGMGNNPVSGIDPDGGKTSPYYDKEGNFLGVDENGFAGDIRIVDRATWDMIYAAYGEFSGPVGATLHSQYISHHSVGINDAGISLGAAANVFTHILDRMPEVDISQLHNGMVSTFSTYNYRSSQGLFNNAIPRTSEANTGINGIHFNSSDPGNIKLSVNWVYNKNSLLGTVENVYNMLGVHEYMGHGIRRFAIEPGKPHLGAYDMQMDHWSWPKTTPSFRSYMQGNMSQYPK